MKISVRALALAFVSILAAGCGEGVEVDHFKDSTSAVTSKTETGIEATLYSSDQQVLAEMSMKDGDTTATVNANGTLLSIPVGNGQIDETNAGEVLHAFWSTRDVRGGETTYRCGLIDWYIILSSCDNLATDALETQCQHEAARDFGC